MVIFKPLTHVLLNNIFFEFFLSPIATGKKYRFDFMITQCSKMNEISKYEFMNSMVAIGDKND